MELTAATPTAPSPAANLLSMLPAPGTASAVSTDLSSSTFPDFSALLTEMIGPGAMQAPALPQAALPNQAAPIQEAAKPAAPQTIPQVELPTIPEINSAVPANGVSGPNAVPPKPVKTEDITATQSITVPVVSVVTSTMTSPLSNVSNLSSEGKPPSKIDEPGQTPVPVVAPTAPQPELERAFAEVRKFELKVEHETRQGDMQQPHAIAEPAEAPKEALVTTDPIANIQQQQLPPRVVAIQKVACESKQQERGKPAPSADSSDATATAAPASRFDDAARAVEHVEQARPAHQVQIPDLPKVQIVRTVAMQVGDAGSEVTIRIQERGGDLSLLFNTGNEPLHQDLQSSVGSLVNALKQEQLQVSNVEVSRKSPIEKVRRMKETR